MRESGRDDADAGSAAEPFVIPAHAGIQHRRGNGPRGATVEAPRLDPRLRGDDGGEIDAAMGRVVQPSRRQGWIPAFAGMTAVRLTRQWAAWCNRRGAKAGSPPSRG